MRLTVAGIEERCGGALLPVCAGITAATFPLGGTNASLTWRRNPTHFYYIQKTSNFYSTNWIDSGLGRLLPLPGSTTSVNFTDTNEPARYYRVRGIPALPP